MSASRYRVQLFGGLAGLFLGFGMVAAFGVVPVVPVAPRIMSTRTVGKYMLVTASAPKGWGTLILESRSLTNAGAWVPRAVARSGFSSGRASFTVSATLKNQALRVRGQLRDPLPPSFYLGKQVFAGRKSSAWRPDLGRGEVFALKRGEFVPMTIKITANGFEMVAGSGFMSKTVEWVRVQ